MNISVDTLMAHPYVQYIREKALMVFGPLERKVTGIALAIIGGVTACYFIYCLYVRQKKLAEIKQKAQRNLVKQPEPSPLDGVQQFIDTAKAPFQGVKPKKQIAKQDPLIEVEPPQKQEIKPVALVMNPQAYGEIKELTDAKIKGRLEKNLKAAQQQQAHEISKNKFKITEDQIPPDIQLLPFRKPLNGRKEIVNGREVGVAYCEGRRSAMEDAELVTSIEFTIQGKVYKGELFGVFDGHGGDKASQYVKDHLAQYLIKELENGVADHAIFTEEHIFKALKACCQELDKDYIKTNNQDGTTATFALILGKKIWVANVGDSRTILSHNKTAIQLTEDAKPLIDRYKKKIEKLGGYVLPFNGRVIGQLAVGRAIGDHEYTAVDGKKYVVPNPKISCYSLNQIQNGYLILACDGVYDVWTTNETVQAVNDRAEKGESIDVIAKRLVWSVINSGSNDNVSMMIVKL